MDIANMQAHDRIVTGAHRVFITLAIVLCISIWLWLFEVIDQSIHTVATMVLGATIGAWLTTAVRLARTPRLDDPVFGAWSFSLQVLGSSLVIGALAILLFA